MIGITEIILITSFVGIIATFLFLAWYFVNRAKAKERQFLIEKGIKTDDIPFKRTSHFSLLKTGIIVVGISLSLFIIEILGNFLRIGDALGFAIILLFAGISMILANLTGKKDNG